MKSTTNNWPLDLNSKTFVELRDWANARNNEPVIFCMLDANVETDPAAPSVRKAHEKMEGILAKLVEEGALRGEDTSIPRRALDAIGTRLRAS